MSKPEDSATAIAAIYSQALSLSGHISKETNFDIPSTKRQYEALKGKLLAVDPSAEGHLPIISYNEYNLITSRSSTRLAINQLCAYIEGKYATDSKEPDIQSVTGPVVNFLLMLPEYGLTVKWAVAASMLSSLEVITNTNLSKLKIPHDPSESFDGRLNKLNNALKSKGIELPALLLSALYKVRNKVIHEGKEPTAEELTTIFNLLTSMHEKTK